jgi:hypothetical protein
MDNSYDKKSYGEEPTYGNGEEPTYGNGEEPTYGNGEEPTYGNDEEPTYGNDEEPTYGMDNSYDKKSYDEEPTYGNDEEPTYGNDNSYVKKSYGEEPTYGTQYSSYGKDNKYKSKDSVDILKLKCKNTNINLNGIEANIGGVVDSVGTTAAAQGTEEASTSSSVNGEKNNHVVKKFLGKDFDVICISNNNNNNAGAGGDDNGVEPCDPAAIEDCFERSLAPTFFSVLVGLFGPNGAGITVTIDGSPVLINSFAELCAELEGISLVNLISVINQILDAVLGTGVELDPIDLLRLQICLALALDIEVDLDLLGGIGITS